MDNQTFQRTSTEGRIKAGLCQESNSLVGISQRQFQLLVQAVTQLMQYQFNDFFNLFCLQRFEHNDVINTVQEFRTEEVHQHLLNLFSVHRALCLHNLVAAKVTGHDNQGILEVNDTAFTIGQTAIVQNLQQYVKDICMCLFDFVQQDYAVRMTAYSLCQLTAFIIADVSRRRTDQTRYGMLLHVFAHIDTHHVAFIIKEDLCQGLSQLGFADTGRTKEDKGANRTIRILDTGTRTDNSLADSLYCLILTDNMLVQNFLQVNQFSTFTSA